MSFVSRKLCRNGPSCEFLAKDKCKFYHPASDYRGYDNSYFPKAKKYDEFEKYQNDDYVLPQNVNKFAKKYEEERKITYNNFEGIKSNDPYDQPKNPPFQLKNNEWKTTLTLSSFPNPKRETQFQTKNPPLKFNTFTNTNYDHEWKISTNNNQNIKIEVPQNQNNNINFPIPNKIEQNNQMMYYEESEEDEIKSKPMNKVNKETIVMFLLKKGLKSSGSKAEVWLRAKQFLNLPINDEELAQANQGKSSMRKFVDETTTKFLKDFNKNFVVPTAAMRFTVCNKFVCNYHTFGQNKQNLKESFGMGTEANDSLENVGKDFAVGLSAPKKNANIVFYAPKKQRVLAFMGKLDGSMNFEKPLTDYFDITDAKMWTQIFTINGRIFVIQREAGYTKCHCEKTYNHQILSENLNDYDAIHKKEWGFYINSEVYCAAWEAFIEYQKGDINGIGILNVDIMKHFSVKVTRFSVRKMKTEDLRKACVERGLINEKRKMQREELIEKLLKVL